MKFIFSFVALMMLASCGKKIEDRSQSHAKRSDKSLYTPAETWSVHSDRPLPAKVRVVINEMEFVNECVGLGTATIERTYRNGTINILSYAQFRQEFFDVDIYNCEDGVVFFSQDYVDTTMIDHPRGAPLKFIIRLRNR